MYEQLKQTFERITPLEDSEWSTIKSAFIPLKVPSNTVLTSIGQTERKVYFVVDGIIRLFCHNLKGEEVTIFLFRENLFASSYPSFVTQTPGNQALQTITDCSLLSMEKQALEKLFRDVPKMNTIVRIVADQRFINSQSIFTSQITHTPQERYLQFENNHGDLLLRVPHHIIASFLGITPVSMSRIRKRLTKLRAIS